MPLNGSAPIDPPEVWPLLWRAWGDLDAPYGTAWDVGANCGQTIGALVQRFERVHAFEPELNAFDMLCDFLLRFDLKDRVQPHSMAVSKADGAVQLAALPEKLATGQLVSLESEGMEYNAKQALADGTGKMVSIPCSTVDTLADRFGPPAFMKIDVEGHELHVLEGAPVVLSGQEGPPPDLLIEIHSASLGQAVDQLLTRYGYDLWAVRHPYYEPNSDLWNTHYWLRASTVPGRART